MIERADQLADRGAVRSAERERLRFLHVVHRNFLVWRKLLVPSLLGNLADPLIWLVGLGFGLGSLLPTIGELSYLEFLGSGMLCYAVMYSASFEALYSAFSRLKIQRTWEGILLAPMTIADVVLGEWVWAALKSTLSGLAILLVMFALGLVKSPAALAMIPVAFLLGLAFAGVALVITSLADSYDFFVYYFTLVITPMMLVSGVFFPAAQLPEIVQSIARVLPLVHATELSRGLTVGAPLDSVLLHLGVIAVYAIVSVLVAIRLVRARLTR
ncbi:MAG TPA: ABC transporter permease [Steroidobacteraceae bacterium]|nr:ABC transporter permease [Steroidobacteraceae bacterium]